jgi:GPH family glycoside/pentoside/hexuronide:cation symporter
MGWLIGMALPAIGFAVIFQTQDGVDGRLLQSNYIDYGILSAVLAGVTAVFCIWGTRTVIPHLPQGAPADAPFTLAQPFRDLKAAFSNYKFRLSTGAGLAFGIAAGVYTTLSLYLGTYFWEFTTDQLAGLVVPTALATLLAFVVLARLGQRYDKPPMLAAACLALTINIFCFIGARLLGLLPANGHPLIYVLALISTGVGVFSIVTLHVVTASLIADLLDEQELSTGRRQEGVFFAAGAFVLKATTGLGAMLAGVVIDIVGLAPGSEPGSIEPSVLQSMGWFTVILTGSMALIAFAFYRGIHMTRESQLLVKQQLAQRAAG